VNEFRCLSMFQTGHTAGTPTGSNRYFTHGTHIRANSHDHSSARRSSRSPDHHSSSSHRHDHHADKHPSATSRGYSGPSSDEFSHRPLPVEALRSREKSNFDSSSNDSNNNSNKSSLAIDETIASRSRPNE
jgi:hypothetical protein